MTSTRPYRGITADDRRSERRARLLEAGLSILGSEAGPEAVTVRGVCKQAAVSARYFYESFTDRDDFVGAVYDWVIADLAGTIQAAVAAAPAREQARAGMAAIVRSIDGDARVARLLFSPELADPVVVRKRHESYALLSELLVQQIRQTFGVRADPHVRATSHFTVAGVAQTVGAWLNGQIEMTADQLIDHLAALLDHLTEAEAPATAAYED